MSADCLKDCCAAVSVLFGFPAEKEKAGNQQSSTKKKSEKKDQLKQPLLAIQSGETPSYYQEPLIEARIARENSYGDWDHLEVLATPSNWRRISHVVSDSESEDETPIITENVATPPLPPPEKKKKRRKRIKSHRSEDQGAMADGESESENSSQDSPPSNSEAGVKKSSKSSTISSQGRAKMVRRKNRSIEGITTDPESRQGGKLMKSVSSASCTVHTDETTKDGERNNSILGNMLETASTNSARYKGKSFSHLFQLEAQIGYGSTANVYKCKRKRQVASTSVTITNAVEEIYAVKVIDKKKLMEISGNAKRGGSLLLQFKQEIEILDKLRHPHIIRLFGMFESEKHLHVVTEYCDGGELFDFVTHQPGGVVYESLARKLVHQITSAVSYMHEQGIIHRDIKLENILLSKKPRKDEEGHLIEDELQVKIIDFGLAKQTGYFLSKYSSMEANPKGTKSRAKTFFGTLGYLAPEMFVKKMYDHSVDVWAVGILTFVLLCGNFPFNDSDATQIAKLRQNKVNLKEKYKLRIPPSMKKVLSDEAKQFLFDLLTFDPDNRITAAKALDHPWLASLQTESE